jgi:O-antigen/teichoic acid export membrane protein
MPGDSRGGEKALAAKRSPALAVRRLASQVGRRLGWGVVDQAASSLTNYAVVFYVAHALGARQFGAFSLAYVTYGFALNASRGLSTDPLLVRYSGTDLPTWRHAVSCCTGNAVVVGLATGACVLAAAALLGGTVRLGILALGLTLPGLLLQDSWRYAFFALGRGAQAFLSDVIWGLTLIPGLALLRVTHHVDVFWCVFVWGAAAGVAACIGPLQARVLPRPMNARIWVLRHRDLGLRFLAENTTNSGSVQLRAYGIGLILGLAAIGYVQAASTLMGPFMVIFFGLGLVTVPEATRIVRRSPRQLLRFCLLVGAGLAIAAFLWGAALLVALPHGLGKLLLGPIWRPTYPLLLPLMISLMGVCLSAGAGTGLHALADARRSLRATVISAASVAVCSVVGAAAGGAVGTMWGSAAGGWIGALLFWWQLRSSVAEACQRPSGNAVGRPGDLQAGGHQNSRRTARSSPGGTGSGGQGNHPLPGQGFGEPAGVALGQDEVSVVQQPVCDRGGEGFRHDGVVSGRVDVAGHSDGAALACGVSDAVEHLSGVLPGGQHADVVDHDGVAAADPGDGAGD